MLASTRHALIRLGCEITGALAGAVLGHRYGGNAGVGATLGVVVGTAAGEILATAQDPMTPAQVDAAGPPR